MSWRTCVVVKQIQSNQSLWSGDAIGEPLNMVNIDSDSGNGLLPDGTKPLPESKLTNYLNQKGR